MNKIEPTHWSKLATLTIDEQNLLILNVLNDFIKQHNELFLAVEKMLVQDKKKKTISSEISCDKSWENNHTNIL